MPLPVIIGASPDGWINSRVEPVMPKPDSKPHAHIPEPRTLTMPGNEHQPTKAEMEEEMDMPGMSTDQVRLTFFRPFKFIRKALDQ